MDQNFGDILETKNVTKENALKILVNFILKVIKNAFKYL